MRVEITGYELWRVATPTGRVIGDSTCQYQSLDCACLCLKTTQGHAGWGYGETVSEAQFARPAWYFAPMAPLSQMRGCFEREWWPMLRGLNPAGSHELRRRRRSPMSYLDAAVRMALWDLMAQQAELPLYQFLGGKPGRNRVRAYGSLLDYPLSEDDAIALARRFARRGFSAIKVKVGAPDLRRDLRRLHAVREAIGPDRRIAIDANENWTCEQAIEAIRAMQRQGAGPEYVEDPLPRDDLEGFARLAASVDVDIVAHDYFTHARQARPFLERGAIKRLRAGTDIDQVLVAEELSDEFDVPLIFGNSMFEINVHAACAMPRVDRLEFSGLAWNDLMRSPVRFEGGYGVAPDVPGHGLVPDTQKLGEWSRPGE